MKLKVLGDNSQLWQWDTGQKLIVEDAPNCQEVHFCHRADSDALVCGIREVDGIRVVDIPNILLQQDKPITAYLCSRTEDSAETWCAYHLPVKARPKPGDYVYTETEVLRYSSLDKRLTDLEGEGLAKAVAAYLEQNPPESGINFTVDKTLTLDPETKVLSVNTAHEPDPDNTLPITAAAVATTVGNIEILLQTI